ncbi:MAG: hypothetical protein GC134_03750 [Proteobacteria bacterium]|nr:hypothetical protein [Pseudomonadota bacterium]
MFQRYARLVCVSAATVLLAACASLPPRPNGELGSFDEEMERAITELKCASIHMPPREFPAQPQEFTCTGGKWEMVYLTYEPDIADKDKVGVVKLVWKEWKDGAHVIEESEQAEVVKFLSYVAARFLPNSRKKEMVELFFGKHNGNMMTAEYGVWYTRRNLGPAYTNKIELRPRKPQYLNDYGFRDMP